MMIEDPPYHRKTINELSSDDFMKFVEELRIKRMALYNAYKRKQEEKRLVAIEKIETKLTKHYAMFDKELASVDKFLDKCDARISKINELLLEGQSL